MNYDSTTLGEYELGEGSTKIDPAITAVLPKACRVVSTESHGVSFWANTTRLDVELENGELKSFFVKILSSILGKHMVHGEFESMKAIHAVLPEFAPEPLAWGSYTSVPDTHFFICEFKHMLNEVPEPDKFAAKLSALHRKGTSPNGKFGFHEVTYAGNKPQYTGWEDSWETFFAKSMRQALDLEIEAKGQDAELDALVPLLFEKVIPRLLRPLESEGRSVKPSLVHGDLWYANSGIDLNTEEPLIYDACCFYAHNEYEFGQWRPVCNRFGAEYLAAYQAYAQISPPEEDFDGRLDLYKLRFNTHVSALFHDNTTLREQMLGDIKDLVARYASD